MKNLVLIITLLLLTFSLPAQWMLLDTPTDNDLYGIHFSNAQRGVAVGDGGAILQTEDGGASWTTSSFSGQDFRGVSVIGNTGFAISQQGWVYKSTNGGLNWNLDAQLGVPFNGIVFFDEFSGFLCGDNGIIFRTLGGGSSWSSNFVGIERRLRDLFFFDDQLNGFLVGDGGLLLKTIDGGISWSPIELDTEEDLYSVFFVDENTGFLSGAGTTVLSTTNGGDTWVDKSILGMGILHAIHFFSVDEGLTIGENGRIYTTQDGGDTWAAINTPASGTLFQVYMDSPQLGYICGEGGVVLKLDLTTSLDGSIGEENRPFLLAPNPAAEEVRLTFERPDHGYTELRLFNTDGQLLLRQPVPPREDIRISTAGWPAGTFLLQVSDGNGNTLTQKLVIAGRL